MGYNISEVSGTSTGGGTAGVDTWTFTADLDDPSVSVVSGNFNEVPIGGGAPGEASGGYTFSALSSNLWGSLSFNTATGQFTFSIDRAAVFASGSDQTVTFNVTGRSGSNADTDLVTINILICMARGTRVRARSGDVPVEELAVGDIVIADDGREIPIRWIGSRRIPARELAGAPALRPVRILAGAFDPEKPSRDLLVSPQHRILLEGWRAELHFGAERVLAPAKGLVNDTTIVIDRTLPEVEYFHLLFDRHEIILTEGLPTESFYPGPYSLSELDSGVREELLRLFPEFARPDYRPELAALAIRPREAQAIMGGPRR